MSKLIFLKGGGGVGIIRCLVKCKTFNKSSMYIFAIVESGFAELDMETILG